MRHEKRRAQAWAHLNHFWAVGMAGLLDLLMLICASAGAMGFGILAAYAILRVGFAFLRPRQQPRAVKPEPETAGIT
jgi:hypothetical protein